MNNLVSDQTQACGCDKRTVPISNFSVTRKTKVDSYCKECRKARNSESYRTGKRGKLKRKSYLVITEVSDRAVRIALIKNAIRLVNESVARKRRRLWEMDSEE